MNSGNKLELNLNNNEFLFISVLVTLIINYTFNCDIPVIFESMELNKGFEDFIKEIISG